MSTAAMAAMPAEKVGIASGVLAMDRVLAGAVALAATGAVFHALQGGGRLLRRLDRRLDLGRGRALRARHGPHLGLRPRRSEPPGPDPAVAGEPPAAECITIATIVDSISELRGSRLTKPIPTCPLGIRQTAFQSGFCHPRLDVFTAWG